MNATKFQSSSAHNHLFFHRLTVAALSKAMTCKTTSEIAPMGTSNLQELCLCLFGTTGLDIDEALNFFDFLRFTMCQARRLSSSRLVELVFGCGDANLFYISIKITQVNNNNLKV